MALIHKRFAHRQKPNNARGVSRLPGGTQADIMYLFDEGSGSPIDLVSNAKPLDFLGSAGWEASQKGIGVFSPAAGADHGLVQAGNRIGNGASSLAIFGQYTPLNINDALLARWGASGALSWILTHNSNGLALAVTDSSTMATAGEGRYTNPLTIGKEYTFFFSWDGTTNFRCFLNGEKVALNVWWSNGLTSISNGNSDLYLLRHGSSGTSGKYHVRFAGMYVDKFVPDSVAESITREPYRHIYQPRRRWVPFSGAGGTTFNQAVAGSITSTGTLTFITSFVQTLTGSITATGTLARKISTSVEGSITATGSVLKKTIRVLTGSITSTGALASELSSDVLKTVTGSITATGALTKKVIRSLSGSISSTGAITKKTSTDLDGSIGMSGDPDKGMAQDTSGSITPTGDLTASAPFVPAPDDGGGPGPDGSLAQRIRRVYGYFKRYGR